MTPVPVRGSGTREDPWVLTTPSGSSEYQMYRDESADPPALVCVVGTTVLGIDCEPSTTCTRCSRSAATGCFWAALTNRSPPRKARSKRWGRSPDNPVGGWYGLKKGLRGRFGMYMPPLLEALGLAEVEHDPRSNRMRAL